MERNINMRKTRTALKKFHANKKFCPCCGKKRGGIKVEVKNAIIGESISEQGRFEAVAWADFTEMDAKRTHYYCEGCGFELETGGRYGEELDDHVFTHFDSLYGFYRGVWKTSIETFFAFSDKSLFRDENPLPIPIYWDMKTFSVTVHESNHTYLIGAADSEKDPNEIQEIAEKYLDGISQINFCMNMKVRFNRPIDRKTDWISPEGCTILLSNGEEVEFGFLEQEGRIVDDGYCVEITQRVPDYDTFPDIRILSVNDLKNFERFTDIYINLGDNRTSPGLEVVKLSDISFSVSNDEMGTPCDFLEIRVPDEKMQKEAYV